MHNVVEDVESKFDLNFELHPLLEDQKYHVIMLYFLRINHVLKDAEFKIDVSFGLCPFIKYNENHTGGRIQNE